MEKHGAQAYLINTGWVSGKYGVGHRIPLTDNWATVDAIFSEELENAEYETLPVLNLQVPKSVSKMDSSLLNPRNAWADKEDYDTTVKKLVGMFIENFKHFTDTEKGKALVAAGPQLS